MNRKRLRNNIWFAVSLFIALFLTVVPLPVADEIRPDLVALIVIYQMIYHPRHMSLGVAFLLGLLVDIMLLSMLGQHALGLTLLCYLVLRFRTRLVLLNPLRQAPTILLMLMGTQVLYGWIYAIAFGQIVGGLILVAPLISVLIWIMLVTPLSPASRLQKRFAH